MFWQKKIIAHRGAWKDFNLPQNSIASLLKAQELPIGGIELDIQLTKDGEIIVYHDDQLHSKFIHQLTFEEIKSNDTKHIIPKFDEYYRNWNKIMPLWIELKTRYLAEEKKDYLIRRCLEIIGNHISKVSFISFEIESLAKIASKGNNIPTFYLDSDYTLNNLKQKGVTGIDFNYKVYQENTQLNNEAHQLGFLTNSWTVNHIQTAEILINQKIDFITTDEIQLFLDFEKN